MILAALTVLAAVFTPDAALRKALASSAEWTMERRLAESDRTLVSSGRVDCRAGEGIVWKVTEPFESTVTMTTNAMVFADEDGTRVKMLDELPHYAEIRKATDAFAAGDDKAFDGVFKVSKTCEESGWTLTMTPAVRAMRHLFVKVELSGAALPTNVVMHAADGGVSVIRFRED